jgi:hypothetical protein
MVFAQGSRSQLTYVVENTFGTTPGSPTMIELPINTHSLGLTKQTVESGEIRSDRQIAVSRHGNKEISGDVVVEFRPDDYDNLLESALFGQWDSSGRLDCGITPQYLSIEDGMLDVSKYRLFTGCAVRQFQMSMAPNAMVTATFSFTGKGMSTSSSSADDTPVAPSGFEPFDSFSGEINEGGSPIATVTSLDFTIDNGLQPTFVIGSPETPQLEYGRAKISGTMQAYFADLSLYNKFVNETESELNVSMTDGETGNTYTFYFPRTKYNGGDVPLANEQSRIMSVPFVALYDTGEDTSMYIVRT